MNGPIIALAAGGTGGHLFPAKALASALLTRGPRPVLVTDARGEAFEIAGHHLPVHRIAAKSPRKGYIAGTRHHQRAPRSFRAAITKLPM